MALPPVPSSHLTVPSAWGPRGWLGGLRVPIRAGTIWLGFLLVAGQAGGCRQQAARQQTPSEAFAALRQAARAGRARQVFELLDQPTRWSVMSSWRAQREIHQLVRAHYPKGRQARELRRTRHAAAAADAPAFFAAICEAQRLLEPLARLTKIDAVEGSGSAVTLISGQLRLAFCRHEKRWGYCGLREKFDQLKLSAARDLDTVRESVESGQ